MSYPKDIPLNAINLTGNEIKRDLPCINCRYNLRGLSSTGKCPECGSEIEKTLRGEKLCYLHPEPWNPNAVQQWIEGMICILASFVLQSLGALMAVDPGFNRRFSQTRVVTLYTLVIGFVVGNWGIWKIACRERICLQYDYLVRQPTVAYMFAFVITAFDIDARHYRYQYPVMLHALLGTLLASLAAGLLAMATTNLLLKRLGVFAGWSKFGLMTYVINWAVPGTVIASILSGHRSVPKYFSS